MPRVPIYRNGRHNRSQSDVNNVLNDDCLGQQVATTNDDAIEWRILSVLQSKVEP